MFLSVEIPYPSSQQQGGLSLNGKAAAKKIFSGLTAICAGPAHLSRSGK